MSYLANISRRARAFGGEERRGIGTLELALWMPLSCFVLFVCVDVCFVVFAQARGFEVAAVAARKWSVTPSWTYEDARTYVRENAAFNGHAPDVSGIVDPGGSDERTVEFSYRLDQLDLTGVLGLLSSQKVSFTASRILETD